MSWRDAAARGGWFRPLLVGEVNPYGRDPDFALYPRPRYASGNRLRVILGLSDRQYLEAFDRMNLCDGLWSARRARLVAASILAAAPPRYRLVLLGRKVASAFGLEGAAFLEVSVRNAGTPAEQWVLVLPHPSGLNRLWNEPGMPERARASVALLLGRVAPESGYASPPTEEEVAVRKTEERLAEEARQPEPEKRPSRRRSSVDLEVATPGRKGKHKPRASNGAEILDRVR